MQTQNKQFLFLKRKITKLFFLKLALIERIAGQFISYSLRPKRSSQVGTWSDALKREPKTAIVIQGPLLTKNDFTLETVRLYKKHYKNSTIILSTWKNEDPLKIEEFKREGVEILLNDEPSSRGPRNINKQIVSSLEGIRYAQNIGAEYVLKSRTDQRMYAVNAVEFMINLLNTFPIATGHSQKRRIISASLATLKYRPYGVSDMFMFGHVDDMLTYWNPPLDTREVSLGATSTIRDFTKSAICEIYLTTNYLKKIGKEVEWTLKDSLKAYADHFIIVDHQSLDLYWHKYDHHQEQRFMNYDTIKNDRLLTFADWFNLYTNLQNHVQIREENLDEPFNSPIEP